MSKSYRKYPVVKQEKVNKRVWNRKIRNGKVSTEIEIPSGAGYKKVLRNFDTWQYRWSLAEAIESWKRDDRGMSLEEWIEYWRRTCIRK